MTEFEVRRVVVACASAADTGMTTADAAALASRWRVALYGIYFEDENLYRAAELAIAPHIGLTATQPAAALSGADVKEMFERHARDMHRSLEDAARRYRLAWSFGTLRGTSVTTLPVAVGDLLIVDAGSRPFSGGWRPRSTWLSAIADIGTTVLVRRGHAGRDIAIVAPSDAAASEHLIEVAMAVTPEDASLVIFTAPEVRPWIEKLQSATGRKIRVEPRPAEVQGVVARLRHLAPGLIAIDATENPAVRHALLEGTRGDLLIVT